MLRQRYILPCSRCGEKVERKSRLAFTTCFDCKKKRMKEVWRSMPKAMKKDIMKKRAVQVKIRKEKCLKEMKERNLSLFLAEEQKKKDKQALSDDFIKRMGGVKVGNRVKWPEIYYPKT